MSDPSAAAPVGLIAGLGRFPIELARAARGRGQSVVAIALRDLASPAIADEVDRCEILPVGQIRKIFATFHDAGVDQVVLAGKAPKTILYRAPERLDPDDRALALLASLANRNDDSILATIAEAIEAEGFALLPQAELVPELLAPEGALGRVVPSQNVLEDVAFGWPIAKALGDLDIGQTVVVHDRAVFALEAVEGTDEAIRRGCALGQGGATVVKVAKPDQDPRFDVPAVGLETIRTLVEGKAAALAVEAGRTLLLDREALLGEADAAGIAVLGVDADRLTAAGAAS